MSDSPEEQPEVPGLDPGALPGGGAATATEDAPAKKKDAQPSVEELRNHLVKELQKKYPHLTDEVIAQWKTQFKRVAIFPIFDDLYVIRPLSRKEWKMINKPGDDGQAPNQDSLEEQIALRATVFPELDPTEVVSTGIAGVATAITNYVELISGFQPAIGPILL